MRWQQISAAEVNRQRHLPPSNRITANYDVGGPKRDSSPYTRHHAAVVSNSIYDTTQTEKRHVLLFVCIFVRFTLSVRGVLHKYLRGMKVGVKFRDQQYIHEM